MIEMVSNAVGVIGLNLRERARCLLSLLALCLRSAGPGQKATYEMVVQNGLLYRYTDYEKLNMALKSYICVSIKYGCESFRWQTENRTYTMMSRQNPHSWQPSLSVHSTHGHSEKGTNLQPKPVARPTLETTAPVSNFLQ